MDSAIGSYFAAGFGCEVTALTAGWKQGGEGSKLWRARYVVQTPMLLPFTIGGSVRPMPAMVTVPLDLPAFINALAPNGRMHFVGVKFVPIIGE